VSTLPTSSVTGSSANARVPSAHAAPRSKTIDVLLIPAPASERKGSGSVPSTGPDIFSVARARVGIGPTNWPHDRFSVSMLTGWSVPLYGATRP
jgi:hypothetical protein